MLDPPTTCYLGNALYTRSCPSNAPFIQDVDLKPSETMTFNQRNLQSSVAD